mgnify:CR=1 FL=1
MSLLAAAVIERMPDMSSSAVHEIATAAFAVLRTRRDDAAAEQEQVQAEIDSLDELLNDAINTANEEMRKQEPKPRKK